MACLGATTSLFHGYAYREAIIGVGMMPLVAYLLGFSLIQYAIAMLARAVGNLVIHSQYWDWVKLCWIV